VTTPDDEWRALAPETRRAAWRNARRLRAHPDPVVSAIAARHARRYLDARTWHTRAQWLAIGLFLADVLVAGIVLGWLSGGPAASRPGALERSLIWLAAVLVGLAIMAPYVARKVRIIRLYRLELANKLTLGSVAPAGAAALWPTAGGPAGGGPALTAGRELSVRYDKRRVLRQCSWVLSIAGCLVVILVGQGLSTGITPAFGAVAGLFAVFGLLLVVPSVVLLARWVLPGRPIVELDADGVHMPSIACDLPWDQLAEVRLLPLRYARRGGQGAMVIAFVPRDPPAVLAAITGGRRRKRLARSLRVYGTPMSVSDGLIDHSAEQVAAAAAAFAALPVRRY
jgi:hypothetical protein